MLNGGGDAASAVGGGPGMAARAHDAIMACADPPPMELWTLFKSSYGAMYDQSKELSDQLLLQKLAAQRVRELAAAFGIPEEGIDAYLKGDGSLPAGLPGMSHGGSRRVVGPPQRRSEWAPTMSRSTPAGAGGTPGSTSSNGGGGSSPLAALRGNFAAAAGLTPIVMPAQAQPPPPSDTPRAVSRALLVRGNSRRRRNFEEKDEDP